MKVYDSAGRLKTVEGTTSSGGTAAPVIVGNMRNLVIQSISTVQATLTADEVIVKLGGTGAALLLQAISLTFSTNLGVGLNGFETGAVRGPSRWYYVWLISDGTNTRVVLEDAGAGDGVLPAGPDLTNPVFAGYTYMAMVGQIRLDATGSGDIVPFAQRDRAVWFEETVVFTARAMTTPNVFQVLSGADLTSFRSVIPPTAVRCSGTLGLTTNNTWAASISACSSAGTVDPVGIGAVNVESAQASALVNGFWVCAPFDMGVRGGNIQWRSAAAAANNRLLVSAYTF